MKGRRILVWIGILLLSGCAGLGRGCTNWKAESFGADWVIVQFDNAGKPFNCWQLRDVSVVNEHGSDGIHWKSKGHMVHIAGVYNRVQVDGGDYAEAAKIIGVDINQCQNGHYPTSN